MENGLSIQTLVYQSFVCILIGIEQRTGQESRNLRDWEEQRERSHRICQALNKEGGNEGKRSPSCALQNNVLKRSVSDSPSVGAVQASWPAS